MYLAKKRIEHFGRDQEDRLSTTNFARGVECVGPRDELGA